MSKEQAQQLFIDAYSKLFHIDGIKFDFVNAIHRFGSVI